MLPSEDKNRIENLKKALYSRIERPQAVIKNNLIRKDESDIRQDWEDHDTFYEQEVEESSRVSSFSKWVFYFSLLFFIVATAVGLSIYFRGSNIISSNNIDISIAGPVSIGGGQELDLDVTVKNQNNVDLKSADLKVQYPEGTRNPDNIAVEQANTVDSLGPIPAGGSVKKRIRAVFFGEQNSQKAVTFAVEYGVQNSNAIFDKEKTENIEITSVPVTLTVTSLKEINSNQNLEFAVDLVSNSSSVIKNVLLSGEYGFGFTFSGSDPAPVSASGNNTWFIGDLNPGQHKTVKVRGVLQGQDGEDRAFRFTVGIQSQTDSSKIDPEFLSATQTISIKKPFIGIDLSLDGSTDSTYSTQAGKNIRGDITWVNNSPSKVTDAKITVTLSGTTLDKSSVQTDQGFYDSLSNSIVWDKTNTSNLAVLSPGDTGQMNFNLNSFTPQITSLAQFKNAEITLNVNVSGRRVDNTSVPVEILSTVSKKIHFDTSLSIVPQIVYSTGPFTNTGPIPAKSEKTTTYTVTLAATNTFNDAQGVKVTASLPAYVKWLAQTSPSSEQVTYNPDTSSIEWDPGSLPAGTGFSTSPRQVSFQISFTPSVSQVGAIPVLVNNINLIGTDSFTSDSITDSHESLTTKLSSDPNYQNGDEIVQK